MPKRTDIRRILVIGAGPIVIGQACEFDYSGSQACRALLAEGYEVILINSNPATIMTDPNLATKTYIEPITPEMVTRIIAQDRPDALLPTMGGQTALNIAHTLHQNGVLAEFNVQLIGANFNAIHTAEDRDAFKVVVEQCGLESLHSETATTVEEGWAIAGRLGFPIILRPAFTMGGSGGGIVYNQSDFEDSLKHGLEQSPINQVLLEESALGWKEYEYEVMRDAADNVVIVSSVENIDPMGIHTGDSMTVAPAMTLSDREYHHLRDASIAVIRAVGVEAGGCNIQFAIHPQTGRVIVIEMNPRVSRSSALVSKATGVPIAKIAAKLAVGYTLDELTNDITRTTPACFEPALDYVVTKIPRFAFEKFPGADATLSPQMKSVGEVMAIGLSFQESFQKALRGLEVGLSGFYFKKQSVSDTELRDYLVSPTENRLHWVYQALHQGFDLTEISTISGLDPWFLHQYAGIIATEKQLATCKTLADISNELFKTAKTQGFGDAQMAAIVGINESTVRGERLKRGINPVYKAVDTCAAEFEAHTPYFYSSYDGTENEAPTADVSQPNKRVIILGGGPNRIGQGIEFDYCCVHAALSLEKLGYEPIMMNSNPETVSTDYDISHRLYFDPMTPEDTANLVAQEQPLGVIAQLGGQTPLKLAQALRYDDVPFIGTSPESMDWAEDREQFADIMARPELAALGLRCPESGIAISEAEALEIAARIGYPLMVRPSYVLGGRGMRVVYSDASLSQYLATAAEVEPDKPVLIDRFLEGALELDVDAVSDGTTTFVGAILEHVEHAGIHSGDSVCVYPAQTIDAAMVQQIEAATHELAKALQVKGFINIQFAIHQGTLYVLEVNPRASRTVPFVCKATGYPLIHMAVQVMLGTPLATILPTNTPPQWVAVKAPVFPFIKFRGVDPVLGPEMRSTGEVMGLDTTFPLAYAKAMMGAGMTIPTQGRVFVSVNDTDKADTLPLAQALTSLGFELVATAGTAAYLQQHGLSVTLTQKKHEGGHTIEEEILAGTIQLVINTPMGEAAHVDDSYIRKAAVLRHVPMMTTLQGAKALVEAIASLQSTQESGHGLQARSLQSA
ncbi:MAG: carbamoyl-phosphate synthase large subunit [Vampirovibrionales bacterium]|nr:carbamoyl-phosphate synthase large subunit [Vampirovibrionales bacterium]